MNFISKMDKIFRSAKVIKFDTSSKFVIMSDCHRGDGSLGDNFFKNQDIYFHALKYYYKNNYTYIELGDGDELWECKKIDDIMETYSNVFWLMSKFYKKQKLYLLYGNHDRVKADKKYVKKNFCSFFDERKDKEISLFKDIEFHEALVLRDTYDNKILLIHGHQYEFVNDKLWKMTRFFVRYLWRSVEMYGISDPTSTAKNYKKKKVIEKKFIDWIRKRKVMVIAGHTHRPMFAQVGETPYFNDGSCVHPRCIIAIEISGGNIQLVKWCINANEQGILSINRVVLAGPGIIKNYFY